MLVLGITGGLDLVYENRYQFPMSSEHDAAAALIDDGKVVAAIEEERLNRIKHTNKAPISAVLRCLETYGASLKDVDRLAIYGIEGPQVPGPKQPAGASGKPAPSPRHIISQMIKQETGFEFDQRKISFVHHHLAHAMSAFAPSGFEKSLVLSIDGQGDNSSGMVLSGEMLKLDILQNLPVPKSLGLFYSKVIQFMGYGLFDEYKVMGLAPYGDPEKYRFLLRSLYSLLPNGDYAIHLNKLGLIADVAPPRRKGEPFTQTHRDLAAALQEALETIVFHLLTFYRQKTQHLKLCMAGGVAQNCSLNGKIMYSGMFEEVFVQPAAHDAGCAIGAALHVFHKENPQARPANFEHVYLGVDIGSNDEIGQTLAGWKEFVEFEKFENISERAGSLLAQGAVIGWVQGRAEFGPRALGNRSILADPRPPENKDIINGMIKKREAYRPFAPSVIEERVHEFFKIPEGLTQFPYMIFVVSVLEEKRKLLGAVTHVDGTARIQTVSRQSNQKFWDLINRFGELTGVPILLNTSFNNNVEPIVDSVEDALVCFLTTQLNYLVAGDYVVSKKQVGPEAYLGLIPKLPLYVTLQQVKKFISRNEMSAVCEINKNYDDSFKMQISPEVYGILIESDGRKNLSQLMSERGIEDVAKREAVIRELHELWTERLLVFSPPSGN